MTEVGEMWKAIKADSQRRGRRNRQAADHQFVVATANAEKAGLRLLKRSDSHYQLTRLGDWLIDIYPGNRHIYHGKQRGQRKRGPYLDLPSEWTLIDVVRAAIKAGDK